MKIATNYFYSLNQTSSRRPLALQAALKQSPVFIEEAIKAIFDEIQNNPSISDEEKALLAQLESSYSSADSQSVDLLPILDRLVAAADENHPYAYLYHFLRGTVRLDAIERGTETDPTFSNQAMDDLNRSIELNPDFAYSYFVRGIAKATQSNNPFDGLEDFKISAAKGCVEAQAILAFLLNPFPGIPLN